MVQKSAGSSNLKIKQVQEPCRHSGKQSKKGAEQTLKKFSNTKGYTALFFFVELYCLNNLLPVMISKLDYQTYMSEFDSHWVPHSYGLGLHLSKKMYQKCTPTSLFCELFTFRWPMSLRWAPLPLVW